MCLYDITTLRLLKAFEPTVFENSVTQKDKKFNEVQVVMALAADKDGLPVSYKLYKGNQENLRR